MIIIIMMTKIKMLMIIVMTNMIMMTIKMIIMIRPLEKAAINDVIAGQLGPKTETPQPISAMDTEG